MKKCPKCKSNFFVWYIENEGKYSTPTPTDYLEKHWLDNPRCANCNYDLAQDRIQIQKKRLVIN